MESINKKDTRHIMALTKSSMQRSLKRSDWVIKDYAMFRYLSKELGGWLEDMRKKNFMKYKSWMTDIINDRSWH